MHKSLQLSRSTWSLHWLYVLYDLIVIIQINDDGLLLDGVCQQACLERSAPAPNFILAHSDAHCRRTVAPVCCFVPSSEDSFVGLDHGQGAIPSGLDQRNRLGVEHVVPQSRGRIILPGEPTLDQPSAALHHLHEAYMRC